ncbi:MULTISPECIES: hypothetical protein [Marivita]|uniref:Uncharacterized protein n=1 Tax=Marivita cryptomonadis TaxID=505252 RepID=A0A9Q2RYY8_9RHOB|nr:MULTISPECIES: hypothetical protein [Marivita]MCR9170170.1 hypothetical protein [Paracoccaceae bacterium]MBM2320677.1 hypothetical protein [Marivita cryptomonadis]MBM2330257.1 hypothetical protein [Marivita cryptomonadis]MBM2339844.1 hypothetical protein [Marivita cryptomonadis]MBM2344503.1 hypothetical protein [Marivita cryptomonadis]
MPETPRFVSACQSAVEPELLLFYAALQKFSARKGAFLALDFVSSLMAKLKALWKIL